jgi:peptidoglycan/xylan/chitin deacetylase (PgdA/CDA1 family)
VRSDENEVNVARKPLASISLDLDNLWSYLKIHGDAGWASFPSYLDQVVEIVVERFRAHGLSVTVFVVGQDAALAKNAQALRAIADAGHEIANHSFSHEPWFHTYSPSEIDGEITDAESAILRATGQKPCGFRGPGFSLTKDTLRVLAARGYLYDASTFPTFVGPLARAYYFLHGDLSDRERERRKLLFGSISDGLRAIAPYMWRVKAPADRLLLEIPVTTFPLLRVPIHLSYIGYLAGYSRPVARSYFRAALAALATTRTPLSFLLHPLDFVGKDRVDGLSFFPGMDTPTDAKLGLFDEVVGLIQQSFEPVTMREQARVLLDGGRLKTSSLG